MNNSFRLRQAIIIARMELKRVFFSKRSFWVYILALFPALIFFVHAAVTKQKVARMANTAIVVDSAKLDSVQNGDRLEDVKAKLGKPVDEDQWAFNDKVPRHRLMYFDGRRQVDLQFRAGVLHRKRARTLQDADGERAAYAGVFQYFYLRLAIFFGCLGIFMNLFRGEMLDKTLHFWFLAPARRDVLLTGKYLAGLVTALTVFIGGAALGFLGMLSAMDPADASLYWNNEGMGHLASYLGATALACLGYGSVFLASGLLLRNPIVPAIVIQLWESANGFLPVWLQKLSVLYYAQSMCPVAAPVDPGTPALLRVLLAPAEPATPLMATLGLLAVTALVLYLAARAVSRLEINYSTE